MHADFWKDKRPSGIANEIDPRTYKSLLDVISLSCRHFASQPAISNMGVTLTYGELDRLSAAFAAYLQRYTDLKRGDRIAIQMPNLLQYPIAVYGALRAGLIVVNTNPLYTVREMRHQFNDSGARALVYLNMYGDLVEQVLADTKIEFLIEAKVGDLLPTWKGWLTNAVLKYSKNLVPAYNLPQAVSFKSVLAQAKHLAAAPFKVDSDDIAIIQYTGGTTGVAKGAMLTHGNLISNMLQMSAWLKQEGENGIPVMMEGQEVMICPLPLYHIYAFTAGMCMMVNGHHSVLITNPRDTNKLIKEMSKWRFSLFLGLNTLFVSLLDHPKFKRLDFSSLKITYSAGTALVKDTALRWQSTTNCPVIEGYGLTETAPVVSLNPYGKGARLGSVGLPMPSTTFKIIDDDGVEQPLGTRGELCIKGPQVMLGYWQRPEATDEVLDSEGWFKSGDVAVIDKDGFVHIVDRIKDMIIVSGFNVYPNEIEEVVMAHPKVSSCAVIGVSDPKSGEAVKLFAVPCDASLTKEELNAYCRANFTGYKVPKHIVIKDSLPLSPVGKVLRRELRELA
ncbi:long-chain acyl-CoA synthetase [Pseudomonas fluvialis]|uniref:Long-chain-fatty-acid--CoA ligase n=1 Tax=Pseudomonas fluvialis TaxID=1793966 RepID=A0A7X0BQ44_9PSED|nr:AMP-binding protein [Pseudomonas fluvialis]MBB6340513.1 long-chain acyl-CoA synthetase [Pseudomonas fluvialis]